MARRMKVKLTKKVHVLVDCVTLNSWEAQLLDELSAKILNIACESSDLQSLGLCSLEILCVSSVSLYPRLPQRYRNIPS